jgi:hypothetical protein
VSDKNPILINDSCVLFDLVDMKLLKEFFQLEYCFQTTSQVIAEIRDDYQMFEIEKYILNQTLIIDSGGILESIQLIYDKYPGLSFVDCSVLELSARIGGILLSSDKSLRNISKRNDIEVKGVLWIIKELLHKRIIDKDVAIQKLKNYPNLNIRVPITELKKLIDDIQT